MEKIFVNELRVDPKVAGASITVAFATPIDKQPISEIAKESRLFVFFIKAPSF
jgi:hypothetical protein